MIFFYNVLHHLTQQAAVIKSFWGHVASCEIKGISSQVQARIDYKHTPLDEVAVENV